MRRSVLAVALAALAALPVAAQRVTLPTGEDALAGMEGGDPLAGHAVTLSGGGAGEAGACVACHGDTGAGNPDVGAPRLAGQPAWYQWKQLGDYASGERANEIMGPIAKALSDADRKNVSVWYAGQGAVPVAPPAEAADPALLRLGATLSAVGSPAQGVQACGNCHGPAGSGVPPNFPALAGQHAAYHEAQLRAWKDGTRRNDALAVMREIAGRMTDEQIRAAAAWFATVRPAIATGAETAEGASR